MKDVYKLPERYHNQEEWKEMVYDLMNGVYDLEQYPMEESSYIKDEFAKGKYCQKAYEEVYAAKQRLNKRLEKVEDKDVELIIARLQDIGRYLALKMYDYGKKFSEK